MGKYSLDINLVVAGMEINPHTLEEKSLGGSETAGLCMARELAKLGHNVTLFCNTTYEGKHEEVQFLKLDKLQGFMQYCPSDVTIVQRIPEMFHKGIKSKINILWQHDVAIKSQRKAFHGGLWNMDEVWCLSEFHIKQQADIYQVDKDLFWRTRNGIDLIERPKSNKNRNRKRLVYTSRPERGLDILLYDIMPKIWARDKEVSLSIAGYDNTTQEMAGFYQQLQNEIVSCQQRGFDVKHLGALTKKDLYEFYKESGLYVYPTNFKETSCITVMEAQMCGLPMVCTDVGALPETTKHRSAMLVQGNAKSKEYQDKFVDHVFTLLEDDFLYEQKQENGYEISSRNEWSTIAKEWEERLLSLFEERVSNKYTLAKHLYNKEEIIPLKELTKDDIVWRKKLQQEYPYLYKPELYKPFYEELGKELKEELESKISDIKIQRYARVDVALQTINRYLTERNISYPNILDYGSGIGNESAIFTQIFNADVTSVNISSAELDLTESFLNSNLKDSSKISLVQASCPTELEKDGHDVVFCGEVLEHQPEPWDFADKLEHSVKRGGLVAITVPYGQWDDVRKAHLWNYERNDLREMFSHKDNFSIQMCSGPRNSAVNDDLGWWIVTWTANPKIKSKKINMDRKLTIQAPRQTVSVCMIVKDGEDMLRRCLKSVSPVADEIIVVDNGSTDSSVDIAKSFGAEIRTCEPATQIGFDTARNESIRDAKSDWILWIDDDEEFTQLPNLYKYLRHNWFKGYSIKQHHFTVDPPGGFKIDMPIRLFRNHRDVRFFGFVHEHPETKINDGVGQSTILSDVNIAHDGYFTEEGRRGRFMRNINLMFKDRELYPERNLGKFLMIRDWVHLARYDAEKNGGNLTPEGIMYLEKAIASFKHEFLNSDNSQVHFYLSDGLDFYSEALSLLGRGLEYKTYVDINLKDTTYNGKDVTARFESNEDYLAWMKIVLKAKSEPFEGEYR